MNGGYSTRVLWKSLIVELKQRWGDRRRLLICEHTFRELHTLK